MVFTAGGRTNGVFVRLKIVLPMMEGVRRTSRKRRETSNRRTSSIIGIGVDYKLVRNSLQKS